MAWDGYKSLKVVSGDEIIYELPSPRIRLIMGPLAPIRQHHAQYQSRSQAIGNRKRRKGLGIPLQTLG